MHKYENEYNLLLKQREQLIGSIQQANKSFHTAVFSALTVLSMVLTLLFHSNDPLSGWYLFLLAQVVLGLFSLWLDFYFLQIMTGTISVQ